MPSRPQPPFVSSMSTSSCPCQSRLSYANLVSSLSISSLLRQPRLVSINLVSPTPTSSRLYQPRVVQAMQVSYLSLFLFFCMRSFFARVSFKFREYFSSVLCNSDLPTDLVTEQVVSEPPPPPSQLRRSRQLFSVNEQRESLGVMG